VQIVETIIWSFGCLNGPNNLCNYTAPINGGQANEPVIV